MDEASRKRPREEPEKSSGLNLARLERSIFCMEPLDDILKVVSDFLYKHLDRPYVEIEAKLGVLIDKRTNQRIKLPVATETVLSLEDDKWFRFESDMKLEQHRHFNSILNKRVSDSKAPNYRGSIIEYKHTRETDRFYQVDGTKVRVTTDQQTGEVVPNGIVEKTRVANLNIHSPNTRLDFRITISAEIPKKLPEGKHQFERNKDRLSYRHEIWKFDLTQVKGNEPSFYGYRPPERTPELKHELELEFADPTVLLNERKKIERGEPNNYSTIVKIFLNNIRLLAKKAL
ncbi:mRNA triphosphatase CET1 [Basidiobolus meristosporus CBS 931.73]|uniref:mRNA-capping enzyme subunit beta n=1 Tax=Basidiobolus meristosporus CBS 931.73 TaxID=1314790 RepID=A0A1Y1Z6V7_9FUNG|nr:mRNA triphosphatase CET1 [Basidiobolus meristosporus CBS 931.73]|eukprot:ORY05980.1 mRNA triphosphatase CET1 [Basidiobolus meristosporus CBS 931.73]